MKSDPKVLAREFFEEADGARTRHIRELARPTLASRQAVVEAVTRG